MTLAAQAWRMFRHLPDDWTANFEMFASRRQDMGCVATSRRFFNGRNTAATRHCQAQVRQMFPARVRSKRYTQNADTPIN